MDMKDILLLAGRLIGINFALLLALLIADVLLLDDLEITLVSFVVAGVFSAVICYGMLLEEIAPDKKEKVALHILVAMLVVCGLLFFLIAPMSGREYSLPVKSFAVTEALTVILLWKNKFLY